ncbi:hypothetical protein BYT27DRAFT_7264729 [Phlegmacium glaucopus]|nr:hypothetical protein BYT27DRAFT_7264729 [Phlegmacium glaucopus]
MSTERGSKKRKIRSACSKLDDDHDSNLESVGLDMEKDALAQLDGVLEWMDPNLKDHAFSSASSTLVSDIQITAGPPLPLKDDLAQRVSAARLVGADHFMSSTNMHKFLDMLLRLVARPSEASARTWVDAFLYRASAMLPPTKKLIFNVEYKVWPVSVLTAMGTEVLQVGYVDYTTVVTNDVKIARYFLNNPGIGEVLQEVESVLRFFVVEAKHRDVKFQDHVPQVLTQLYAAATKLKKTHIRGTLTNGYDWLFLLLTVNPNGQGATYRISERSYSAAPQETGVDVVVPDLPADMIAGILASWIEHSCEDLLEDEWFV